MNLSRPRCALFVALIGVVGAASAAATSKVSLMTASEQASLIETRHSTGEGAVVSSFTTEYFGNGEIGMAWEDKRVLLLCKKAAYLNLPGMKPDASKLSVEQRQMVAYEAMMAGFGGIAALGAVTGESVEVADDGTETRRPGESKGADGVERYEVATQRMPDGALRVRVRKQATVNNAKPSSPDDTFSTDEDQAARLAELAPTGSWTEVLIHGGPRKQGNDPAMSLKGWVSTVEQHAATVGDARRLHDCK